MQDETANKILSQSIARFPELLTALGFEPGRGNRCRCIICESHNRSCFSYKPSDGVWCCFRCNAGGGVVDLVGAVLRGDGRAALSYLSEFTGIPLNNMSPAERAAWRRRRQLAERAAADLCTWRSDVLEDLRSRRNIAYMTERVASGFARLALRHEVDDEDLWEWIWSHALDDRIGDEIDARIRQIEQAHAAELLAMRRAA